MSLCGSLPVLRCCCALLALAALGAIAAPSAASAQPFHASDPGSGFVPLSGTWQFKTGDNPDWAAESFDDSHWAPLAANASWGAQGYPNYVGFAWYRRHLQVAPAPGHILSLAVLIPPADDAYEVFWNGKSLGTYGAMPPAARWFAFGHAAVFRLPAATTGPEGELAIRFWKAPAYSSDDPETGGFEELPLLGDPAVLALMRAAPEQAFAAEILPRAATAVVLVLLGLAAGVLSWLGRQAILGWLAVYLIVAGAYSLLWLPFSHFGWYATTNQAWTLILSSAKEPALWYLLLAIFGLTHDRRWRRGAHLCTLLFVVCVSVDLVVIALWQHAGPGLQRTDTIVSWLPAILPIYSLVLIAVGLRRHSGMQLWPLAAAAVLAEFYSFLVDFSELFIHSGGDKAFIMLTRPHLVLGPYSFSLHTLFNMLLSFVLILTVAQVQARSRRRQAALELDLLSAREVQRVLFPELAPEIPGFTIATAYLPAGEVGGDFFQTIAVADGLLIVLGDVSGKGLGAAMTVSLIVGTLRTLCEIDCAPSAVLEGLNRRLIGRTRGGFATCLAVLATPDGKLRFANAGHLSPYLSGEEFPLAGALPLGIVPNLTYPEQTAWLPVGHQLSLYTDGVPEARNKRGELYGFERVRQLLAGSPPPRTVVSASCNFGQEDDITVLALTRYA